MISGGQLAAYAQGAWVLAPLMLLSLVLVNAQAVTSLTSERDVRALDLLLVTDLTPKEIVYGKLGGVFYNTKEMVLLPMLLCAALWWAGPLSLENLLYLLGGLAVLYVFAATVGLHAGNDLRQLGRGRGDQPGHGLLPLRRRGGVHEDHDGLQRLAQRQFLPFFAFMVFGGVGLYAVLGVRNPSTAIGWASFLCPFATFYAITSYLMNRLAAGGVPGDGGRLRLHHRGDAGAGDLRVRRGHGRTTWMNDEEVECEHSIQPS